MGVRAVFSWSSRTLSAGAAALFRLMGLQPGPEISLPAVASLTGAPIPQVRASLAELTQAHLIDEVAPARYGFHDLLRAYAVELALAADSPADRSDATQRVLGHYLCTAIGAARLINPRWDPPGTPPPVPGVTPETFASDRDALTWFSVESPVLLAAIRLADAERYDTYVWQLAGAVQDFLCMRREPQALASTGRAALRAASSTPEVSGQAQAHRGLAIAAAMLGDYDVCDRHLRQAASLYAELGDRGGQARCYLNLGTLYERRKDYPQALEFASRALDLLAAQPETGKARGHALCNIGRLLAHLGDTTQALTSCRQALELMQDLGDRFGLANAADNLGFVYHRLGEHGRAAACYDKALGLYREVGARDGEAGVLGRLGDHQEALGDREAALQLWRDALAIFDELGDSDGAEIRARLVGAAAPREIAR
jgi:tetratricopeptide (TPR) repeat protein